ncbi:MAG: polysaccharide biosynthesis protein [Firmicutes bacterium]|nr:polysaccharide biosynthesis protein [Bacillota bacterium]
MIFRKSKHAKTYNILYTLFKDLVACSGAYLSAYFVGRNGVPFDFQAQAILMSVAVVATMFFLFLFRCYRVVWRYAGAPEMVNVIGAHVLSYVVLVAVQVAGGLDVSIAVLTLYAFFSLSFTGVMRFNKTVIAALARKFGDKRLVPVENVIIYGAGYTGAMLTKRFFENPQDGYNPVAILDDDPKKKSEAISGVRIVGGRESIRDAMRIYKASTIIIAITNMTRPELTTLYAECLKHDARVKVVNNISAIEEKLSTEAVSLKSINIEDLLRRRERETNEELLKSLIEDKIVMVTGGAGSIGSELCRQALKNNCKHLVIFDHHENGMFEINEELKKNYPALEPKNYPYSLVVGSVKDRNKLRKVMEHFKPEIVFHAAAYKHVPMMEINADEAVKNNIFGTRNVIEQCEESLVKKFILISTDKAVNPANIMGASKRMAELLVEAKSMDKNSKTTYSAVRFGNVLGSSGSVIPTFVKQINQGGPVTVTHEEMQRYFMTIPEAVKLVMQAGGLADGGEVFVLDMGEPVYIKHLAEDLIKLSGLKPHKDIEIVYSGLRPGEKLFEELKFDDEDVSKTSHGEIFAYKLETVDIKKLTSVLTRLEKASENPIDTTEAENLIFEIVPDTYRNK